MSKKFNSAVQYILGRAYYSLVDKGPTKYGITAETARKHGQNILTLSREQAIWIYHKEYWEYEWISDDLLAAKCFAFAVREGNEAANKRLQSAVNECGLDLVVDGVIGPKTRLAVNSLEPAVLLIRLSTKRE